MDPQQHNSWEQCKPACRYGSKCYRTNPEHLQKYSHPTLEDNKGKGIDVVFTAKLSISNTKSSSNSREQKPSAVIHLPNKITVIAVMGKNFSNVSTIAKLTGAKSILEGKPGNQKIKVFGGALQVANAVNCWNKLIAIAPKERVIEKVYPKTDELVEFFPPPDGIRILKQYQDPQILRLVANEAPPLAPAEFNTIISNRLNTLTNYEGRIKMHAKLGKNVWYLVPDSVLGRRPANEIFQAIATLPIKSFFSMGIADEKLLRDSLDLRKEKESFNVKIVVQHEDLCESVVVTVVLKDGLIRFSNAQLHEEKHITDQICLDKEVDIRLSLENTKLLTAASPLYPTVLRFAKALQVKQEQSGEYSLVIPDDDRNVQVYRIQHKKRTSYIYEDVFNIDIVNVRIFENEEKLLAKNYKLPAAIPFMATPTEVEISSQKWKRMFKFNKPNNSSHAAWTAQEIIAGFPQFLTVVHDVASLLQHAGKK